MKRICGAVRWLGAVGEAGQKRKYLCIFDGQQPRKIEPLSRITAPLNASSDLLQQYFVVHSKIIS